ncbi:hypothetical protein B0H11DRAFT_1769443, partial [Mycena galericulata]
TCGEDAPPWLQHAVGEVSRAKIGPKYEELLSIFVDLETAYCELGMSGGKLSVKERPRQVTEWIKDGRGRTKEILGIANVGVFEEKWWKWWKGMQPEWRGIGGDGRGDGPPEEDAGRWEGLVAPGQNGLLNVVATLYWWACAEKAGPEGTMSTGWEAAVADVTWVLRGLKAAASQKEGSS